MRRFVGLIYVSLASLTLMAAQSPNMSIPGFTKSDAQSEADWEAKFRAIPDPKIMIDTMKRLAARPHHVGSPYDKENSEWILSKYKEWGWDAHIETFNVLFPTPKERLVEMTEPTHFVAKLQEPPVPGDPTSSQQDEQLPTYNAYSIDGDVTAPLVYVNYGTPADYETLDREGISVKGAIVIARYGGSWRGIKPKVAAEHGAIGCLIYSDPRDDGYFQGDVFPKGAERPKDGVQRGSVMDMPLYPGDPLTPGVGATPDAKRLDIKDAPTITKIPVLPISYADAAPLLEALGGPVAPMPWRGALGFTYHIGPGPAKVHLKVKSNWDIKPVNDVIARLAGATEADQWIIRGNHYDGWVNGASDPISGQVSELEEARALGELYKQGWKPKRTIIYCAWDGEEPGLLGSTEWAEEHAAELHEHAVLYLNSDSNGRGYFGAEGSHTLESFINSVTRDINDPEKNISVWKRDQLARIAAARTPEEKDRARAQQNWDIGALGSGSDYTAYLDFLGVASANFGFGGEGGGGGVYHSIYDDYYWFSHFDDPTEEYGRALAQTAGTAMMRMADADLLPYNYNDLASTVKGYIGELQKLANDKRNEIREQNREIAEGVFTATSDPTKTFVPPPTESVPPHLNFAPLENAMDALTRAAEHYQRVAARAQENGGAAISGARLSAVNQDLLMTERSLLDPAGLPKRPWFKHQLYAPGFYTGYGVKTIPAVREAIEQKDWTLADQKIVAVGKTLENEAAAIEKAAAALESAMH